MNDKRKIIIGAAVTGAIATIAASSYFIHKKIEFDRKNVPFKINPKIKSKSVKNVIPLNMYATWNTKDLPPLMKQNYEQLQKDNPEFKHFLYDDAECREFIKTNFEQDVLDAFDKLIPGAYKADLWRCCILYKLGGIYLDIKFKCINGFKFIALTDKEYFVRDRGWSGNGVYNAIMICKAGNPILLKAIHQIVKNTQTEFYGQDCLCPTGPNLFKQFMDKSTIDKLELYNDDTTSFINKTYIAFRDTYILTPYPEYRDEQKTFQKNLYYSELWNKRQIYKNA
jgi:mannosyltransferase OCH1-like enzyme